MVFVIATIEIMSGQREQFLIEFRQLVPLVCQEAGCVEYLPTIDLPTSIAAQGDERPDVVTVVEKWESVDALEAHLVAPHMIQYRAKVKSLVKSVSLQVLEPALESVD